MAFLMKAAEVFRDFVTGGVPSSGRWSPKKSDIRAWGEWIEGIIGAFFSTGGKIYQTRALLNADLTPATNSIAWVMEDPTVANNGIYRKIGGAGTGSWVRAGDLPFSFIVASNPGVGTPNAIQATTSIPVSSSALVILPIAAKNTASPVMVSFNGGAALTVKTNSGLDVDVGGVLAGSVLLGVVSGATFRLLSDQAIALSLIAARDAALAAAEDAEAFKNQSLAAADDAEGYRDDTLAALAAVQPTTRQGFDVNVGQTSVTVAGGYTVGTVARVVLNGVELDPSDYAANDGVTVTFPAITADDIAIGETSARLAVYIGTATVGFTPLDLRYNRRFCEVVADLVYDADAGSPTDNRLAIQWALDTGRTVIIPADPTGQDRWAGYKGCLYQTKQGQSVKDFSRKRSLDPSPNGDGEVWPMWIQTATAVGAEWDGGSFDHRGQDWVSATSGAGLVNVGFASALLQMANRGITRNLEIYNGFDNGLGFMGANLETGQMIPGGPQQAKTYAGYSENCGVGIHTHSPEHGPHQVGGGVNLLTGSLAIVMGWHDRLSRQNFIADYAGGASGMFIGCIGDFAQLSSMGTQDFEGEIIPLGGNGIYSGATYVHWIGCQINDAAGWAAWFDGFSANNNIDLTVKYCGRGGVLLNGRGHKANIRVHDAGHLSHGIYPGIRIRGGHVDGDSYGIQLVNPHVEGPYTSFGVEIIPGYSGQKVYGGSDGGMIQGTLAPMRNMQKGTFAAQNYREFSTSRYVHTDVDLQNAANDTAAAAAGVPIGAEYRNGSIIMRRVV